MLCRNQNLIHATFGFQSNSDDDFGLLDQNDEYFSSESQSSTTENPAKKVEEYLKNDKNSDLGLNLPDILDESSNISALGDQDTMITNDFKKNIDEIEPSQENITLANFFTEMPRINANNKKEQLSERNCYSNSRASVRRLNNPLLEFVDNPDSNMKKGKNGKSKKKPRTTPKKEYYRTKLIRAWKKQLRNYKKIETVDLTRFPYLKLFLQHYQDHKNHLDQVADTASGPETEAKKRESKKKDSETAKTFNNPFVAKLFSDQIYLESFDLYVKSQFENRDVDQLIERFDFKCCFLDSHDLFCEIRWEKLLEFSVFDLLFCDKRVEIAQDLVR